MPLKTNKAIANLVYELPYPFPHSNWLEASCLDLEFELNWSPYES